MRDCPPFGQWQLGRANRGSFGSAAINDLSGAEAEPWQASRLQAKLCSAADPGAALEGLSPRAGRQLALRGLGRLEPRLVARTGRRPACPGTWPQGDLLREHLPLHLRPDHTHDGLHLAALSASWQEQARPPRQTRREPRKLHRGPCFAGRTACRGRRSQSPGPLGSRSDDVLQIPAGHPGCPRANLAPAARRSDRTQVRCRCRWPSRTPVQSRTGGTAPYRHLRQRHRVRCSPFLAEPLDEDLLLRPARPVAKGRHRERHRPLCAASSPERPTSKSSQPSASASPLPPTTTPRANALTSEPRQRPSPLNCCTSSVNPPPGFRQDDTFFVAPVMLNSSPTSTYPRTRSHKICR